MAVVWRLYDGTSTIDFTSATGFRGERGHVTQITNIPGDGSIPEYLTETIPVTIVGTTDDNFAAHLQKFALLQKRAAEYWVDPQQSTPVWYHEKLSAETGERRALVKSLGLAFDQETGSLMSGSPKTTAGKKATLFVERHPFFERTAARIFPNNTPTAAAAVAYDYTAASAEMLSNEGFETAGDGGVDIWANWTERASDGALANEVGSVHGGVDAAKVTAGVSLDTWVEQVITVAAGQEYVLDFWTRGDGTYSGRYSIYDVTHTADIYGNVDTGVTGAVYTEVTRSFTTPAGCTSVRIYLTCPGTATGVAYYDDVSVTLAAHDIVGDVPARINALGMRKGNAEAGSLYRVWLGVRSAAKHGASGVTAFVPVWECESGTNNAAETGITDDNATDVNGASPGGGSGIFVKVIETDLDWDTATFLNVFYMTLAQAGYTTMSDADGRFVWLLRAKVTAGTWQVRLRDGFYNIPANHHDPVAISSTGWNYYQVAVSTISARNKQALDTTQLAVGLDRNASVAIEARRTAGAGNLYLDCLCPIPTDEGFLYIPDTYLVSGGTQDCFFGEGPRGHAQVVQVADAGTDYITDNDAFEAEHFRLPPGDGRIICCYAQQSSSALADQIEFGDPSTAISSYTERWPSLRGAE